MIGLYVKSQFSLLRQTSKIYDIDSFFPDKLKIKKTNKKKKIMLNNISAENMLLLNESGDITYTLSSCNQPHVTNVYTEENVCYYLFSLYSKMCLYYVYFPLDLCIVNNGNFSKILNFSCLLKNFTFSLHIGFNNDNILHSISGVYRSFNWVERESKEFSKIYFLNLVDSRRLLTDYTSDFFKEKNEYKTNSYNLLVQDIFNRVLHWMYIYLYFIVCLLISLSFINKSVLSIILMGEIILLLIMLLCIILASFYGIQHLLVISFFILVFGGLELCLNLLILMI